MSINEEELQKRIETENHQAEEGIDADAYRTVFSALKQKPDFRLKNSLADSVVQRLIAAKERGEHRRDIFLFTLGLFTLVIGMLICIAFISPYLKLENAAAGLSGLLQYKGLILLTVVMVGFFGWLDNRLLKVHQSKSE